MKNYGQRALIVEWRFSYHALCFDLCRKLSFTPMKAKLFCRDLLGWPSEEGSEMHDGFPWSRPAIRTCEGWWGTPLSLSILLCKVSADSCVMRPASIK
jgi:hypothetical protein